jgi:hypothetical protein
MAGQAPLAFDRRPWDVVVSGTLSVRRNRGRPGWRETTGIKDWYASAMN